MLNLDNKFEEQEKTGKTLASLKESRKVRDRFLSIFGFIPESILVHDRGDRALDSLVEEGRTYSEVFENFMRKTHPDVPKDKWVLFSNSNRASLNGALSRFPQNIGRLLVKFYCPENGLVYDPFAGHNSRMQLVFECGRDYVGVDVSGEFMAANREIRGKLISKVGRGLIVKASEIVLIEGSSAKVDLPDGHADFTLTSPPYWDIEYYGDEPEQLGNAKTYETFLSLLQNHIVENFRVLKSGAWCCWFVNDFKKNGVYYDYHADISRLMRDVGFILEGIYIVDLGRSVQAGFIREILKRGVFPKRHEYCVVCRKPGEKIMGVKL